MRRASATDLVCVRFLLHQAFDSQRQFVCRYEGGKHAQVCPASSFPLAIWQDSSARRPLSKVGHSRATSTLGRPLSRHPRCNCCPEQCCSSSRQQSPWERAASNLEQTFTGPLARSLALVAIVIGGLMFMFGEGGAKRQISGIVFGGGLALFAAQFLTWLF